MELIYRAAAPEQLRAAIEAGADVVQCGFADITNASRLMAQHFSNSEVAEAVHLAQAAGRRLTLALDMPMRGGDEAIWTEAVDRAVALGVDAVVVSDVGLLAYIANRHPNLRRHFCLPLSAANAAHIDFLAEAFGIQRAVLPAGFLVEEVVQMAQACQCELEVAARASGNWQLETAGESRPSLDMLGHFGRLESAGIAGLRLEGALHGAGLAQLIATLRPEPASAAA